MNNTLKIPCMETITNTAALFNLPVHFVRAAVAKGDVVAVRAGRKFLVNLDSLAAFLSTGIPQGAAANDRESSSRSDVESAPRVTPISLR